MTKKQKFKSEQKGLKYFFAYFCISEHSKLFSFFPKKTYIFFADKSSSPLIGHVRKECNFFLDGSPKDKLSSKTQPKANRSCFDICPLFQKNKFLAWPHFTFMSALMKKEMRSAQ